jgi:deoxyribonuclease IV
MRIGAHVSTAEKLDKCLDRAQALGCETLQIFASAPQSWRAISHTNEAMAELRRRCGECENPPLFVHGIYLINLATADEAHLERSAKSLAAALAFCEATGARGVIFHVGSHKGAGFDNVLPQISRVMREAIDSVPGEALIIVENSAGAGATVGGTLPEVGAIIRAIDRPRVGVCLDTCHLFASGYDLRTDAAVAATMDEFAREVGTERLVAVHANDSKGDLGGGKDRHENIGHGAIGLDGFRAIMAHAAFRDVPFLLEVPGMDGKSGPDQENVEVLRGIRRELFGEAG